MIKNIVLRLIVPLLLSIPLTVLAGEDKSDKVYINIASVQELDDKLVGVGSRAAQEIVNYRKEHGSFNSLDDLDKVKYIGAKTIEKNKDIISFDEK